MGSNPIGDAIFLAWLLQYLQNNSKHYSESGTKFRFELEGNRVKAKAGLIGTCLKIDLGIVKCHFELGAGKENFEWA